jgi:TolB-like protein
MARILLAFLALSLFGIPVSAADAPKVLVTAFAEISDGPKRDWIARAIQQALVAELARLPIVSPVNAEAETPAIDDAEAAIQAAKAAGAAYVVFGSYQLVEQELRITGQVLEAADGIVLGGIKATGNLRDLFGVEDIVAAQVKRALSAKLAPSTTQPSDDLAERTTIEPTGPVRVTDDRAFPGSDLEQSLASGRPYVSVLPYQGERQRYRYGTPYTPYGWSPYGYGYGYAPRDVPRHGYSHYNYGYNPPYIYVPKVYIHRRPTVITVPVVPSRPVPNGNYNRGPGNTMESGPGNTMESGPGNTMTGRGQSGNTITGGSGNTNGAR